MIEITDHADKRIRKRMGVKRKAVRGIAIAAYYKGLKHNDTKGYLHKYLDNQYLQYHRTLDWRIYNNHLFCFKKIIKHDSLTGKIIEYNRLLTVIKLNNKLRRCLKY